MKKDFLMIKAQGRKNAQSKASSPNHDATKKNHFFALCSRGDQISLPVLSPVYYKCSPLILILY